MANPMDMLKKAVKPGKFPKIPMVEGPKEEAAEPAINEMVEKVFCTRNLVHFAHWNTQSFASHIALNELYEDIVYYVDDPVETYQGEFGLLQGLECCEAAMTTDIIGQIQGDSDWIRANRTKIANGSTVIENLLDGLSGIYSKTLYKLKNLK